MTSTTVQLPTRTTPLSVFIIDDVEEIQRLAELWLKEVGCNVTCASTGREAVRELKVRPVDVVLTDVIMPDGDGLEVISEVRRTRPEVRVVAISGGGVHLNATDCLKFARGLGAHAVLMKPFNRQQLLSAMNAVLQSEPGEQGAPRPAS